MCGRALHPTPPLCRAWLQRKPARHRLPSGCCRDTVADDDEIGSVKTTGSVKATEAARPLGSRHDPVVSAQRCGWRSWRIRKRVSAGLDPDSARDRAEIDL